MVRSRRSVTGAATAPNPLPPAQETLDEPLRSFPSWFLKITCDRCGKDRVLNKIHAPERQREMPIRVLLATAAAVVGRAR
jgi:hypothetical protein